MKKSSVSEFNEIQLATKLLIFEFGFFFQGDKLMRLPSHSYDKNDLARSLSVAVDGPEEVIEADDYLQPTPRASVEIPTTPVSSKVRSISYFFVQISSILFY